MSALALTEHQEGALFALGAIGAVMVTMALVWLWIVFAPEIQWWTLRRLPLQPEYRRDLAAAVVAGARRSYVLRIPYGLRIVVALGGERGEQERLAELYGEARRRGDRSGG